MSSKEKTVQESAAQGSAAPAAKARKKGDLMYLGPTIPGAARHGTVFRDGILPQKAQECIKELPMMERLFVETDKAPEAAKALRRKQGVLGAVYSQTEARFLLYP